MSLDFTDEIVHKCAGRIYTFTGRRTDDDSQQRLRRPGNLRRSLNPERRCYGFANVGRILKFELEHSPYQLYSTHRQPGRQASNLT